MGSPLEAYFPVNTYINLKDGGKEVLEVGEPGRKELLIYQRCPELSPVHSPSYASVSSRSNLDRSSTTSLSPSPASLPSYQRRVRDVLVKGEGDAGPKWGTFDLVGRVRPYDGFVSLMKQYRGRGGRWLYGGYLVGDQYGNLAGTWRDTEVPAALPGYEGPFFMHRSGSTI